ncbi:hypothetical protein CCR85_05135 [Rhodothalassium salexigens]|uniref:XrtA/PEP-CTERM system TPR-repeat protein PrsT n=1 Tax=Rhodothalassium salexigens TaxID=1086 RepID=UPI0019123E4D|nr:XrtA/PEP-CTERM system TPR-repeat protein PrsT [Rhodothalassium salexigens]MBK5910876.1 hypothetical protein [Rhodothalassium salexigens]MBK5920163.1 hypothetical protein [Rhodothalassium salexigens]
MLSQKVTIAARRLVIGLIAVGLAACSESDPIEQAEGFIDAGREAMENGRYQAAEIELKNAVKVAPDYAPARVALGSLHLARYDLATAEKEFRRALQSGGDPVTVWPKLMRTLVEAGDFDAVLDAVKQLDPTVRDLFAVKLARTDALIGLGRVDEAEGVLDRLPGNAGAEILTRQAMIAASRGDETRFRALVTEAIESPTPSADAWFLNGQLQVRDGDLDAARESLARAYAIEPYASDTATNYVVALLRTDQLAQAEEVIKTYARTAGELTLGLAHLRGVVALLQRDYETAKTSSERILSANSDFTPAMLVAGFANNALKNDQLAVNHLKRVPGGTPGLRVTIAKTLAQSHMRLGEPQAALEALEAVPLGEDGMARRLAVRAALEAGDRDRGRDLLAELAATEPDNSALASGLALMQLATGETAGARDTLTKLREAGQTVSVEQSMRIALLQLQAGDTDGVRAIARDLADAPERPALSPILEGLAYVRDGDMAAAEDRFQRALDIEPGNNMAVLSMAVIRQRQGNTEEAERLLRQGLTAGEADDSLLPALVKVLLSQGRLDDAVDVLARQIDSQPDSVIARGLLSRIRLAQGQPDEAAELASAGLDRTPDNPALLRLLGLARFEQGDPGAATTAFERLVDQRPEDAAALLLLARAQAADGGLEQALSTIEKSVALAPDAVEPRLVRTQVLIGLDQDRRARLQLDALKELAPDDPRVLRLAGQVAVRQDRLADAQDYFETLMDVEASNENLVSLSRVMARRGRSDDAVGLLQQWLAEKPEDAFVRAFLFNQFLTAGDYDAAWAAYEALPDTGQRSWIMLNNAAWTALQLDKLATAKDLAERALDQRPDEPQVLDTLGVILLEQGDTAAAREHLATAAANSALPDVRLHYAKALIADGAGDEAKPILRDLARTRFAGQEEARTLLAQLP